MTLKQINAKILRLNAAYSKHNAAAYKRSLKHQTEINKLTALSGEIRRKELKDKALSLLGQAVLMMDGRLAQVKAVDANGVLTLAIIGNANTTTYLADNIQKVLK